MSLVEALFAVGLLTTVIAATVPPLLGALEDFRVAGAARYVAARVADVRMQAVTRSADIGMRIVPTSTGYTVSVYMDGNANGVRTRDIQRGIDAELEPASRISDHFRGVDFGAVAGTPAIDPAGSAPGTDPIRLGGTDILTFTPHGTSTSGSLYLCGKSSTQYAVRILGQTGRTRLFKYSARTGKWTPL